MAHSPGNGRYGDYTELFITPGNGGDPQVCQRSAGAVVIAVCQHCGAVVVNRLQHDIWHRYHAQ